MASTTPDVTGSPPRSATQCPADLRARVMLEAKASRMLRVRHDGAPTLVHDEAAVRNVRGDATSGDREHATATLKHFTAHGEPESGMNRAPASTPARTRGPLFFKPFPEALRAGDARSITASYNEGDGVSFDVEPVDLTLRVGPPFRNADLQAVALCVTA